MTTRSILAISAAGFVLTGALVLNGLTGSPSEKHKASTSDVKPFKTSRKARHQAAPEFRNHESETRSLSENDEAANLENWHSRFETLVSEHGSREQAVQVLMREVDAVFSKWVQDQITPLAELSAGERYDRLAEIEISVQEGAAAVLEQIGIEGSRRVTVAATALEAISAEIQYAEAAPDPASRLAMLRLDREREARLGTLLATADEAVKTQAMSELEAWYEAGLEKIFPPEGL